MTNSTYYQFGKKKYVFARNSRFGFIYNYGVNPNLVDPATGLPQNNTACAGVLLDTNASCNPTPLPERLYAGGATSHRGFPINGAGPRDLQTGFPVGGSSVFINTFELRLPAPTLPYVGDSVSFVIFHDMGNVFYHVGDTFKSIKNFRQPDEATCKNTPNNTGTATPLVAVRHLQFQLLFARARSGRALQNPGGPHPARPCLQPQPARLSGHPHRYRHHVFPKPGAYVQHRQPLPVLLLDRPELLDHAHRLQAIRVLLLMSTLPLAAQMTAPAAPPAQTATQTKAQGATQSRAKVDTSKAAGVDEKPETPRTGTSSSTRSSASSTAISSWSPT